VTGVRRVYLAGAPGEDRDRLESAGVDEFVHVGVDALDVLRRAQQECGVDAGGAR
jgi:methylmalonyl-CoA mutase